MDTEGNRLGQSGKAGARVSGRRELQSQASPTADYLTAAQIADLLQVSEKSVYRWAASDPTFPMLKIGGTVRFPRERLLRWLRDREQGPGRPLPRQVRSLQPRLQKSTKHDEAVGT